MKHVHLTLAVCALTVVLVFYFFGHTQWSEAQKLRDNLVGISYVQKNVMLAQTMYALDIADTDFLQERGLSYRKTLATQTGMLFIFDKPDVYQFWMKGMNFPLDIVWLDQSKKVVYIQRSLSQYTYPASFGPKFPTQYVIEINAGDAQKIGLKIGDTVRF